MNIEKELQEIGLQEKEAKVYVAMLELGKATAQDIAKKSDVNRATTYFVMENLMKRGLASAIDEGTRQYFIPEEPSQLEAIFEKQRIEFESRRGRVVGLVAELSERNALKTRKPVVKYYLGKEGLLRMANSGYKNIYGGEIATAFSQEELTKYISPEERFTVRKKRSKNKVKSRAILNPTESEVNYEPGDAVIPIGKHERSFPGDVTIYGDMVQLISYEDMTGIVIENKNIATTLRTLFDMAFEYAEKKYKAPGSENGFLE